MWTAVQQVTLAHTLVCEFHPLTRLITCKRHRRKTCSKSDYAATCTAHLCSLARSFTLTPWLHSAARTLPSRLGARASDRPRRGNHGTGVPSSLDEGSGCRSIESMLLLMKLEPISYVGGRVWARRGVEDGHKLLGQCA